MFDLKAPVADVTTPPDRGRVYGLLGAVGGAGFMLGPVIGGVLGQHSPSTPLFAAAALTVANIACVVAVDRESLRALKRRRPGRRRERRPDLNPVVQSSGALRFEALRFIFLPTFLFFLAGATMQGNISVLLTGVMRFGPAGIGLVLLLVGVLDVVSQGVLARRLLPRFGEIGIARAGLFMNVIEFAALAGVGFLPTDPLLIGAVILFMLGDGLFQASSSALIVNAAPPDVQRRIQEPITRSSQSPEWPARCSPPRSPACIRARPIRAAPSLLLRR